MPEQPKLESLSVSLSFSYKSWWNETPFSTLEENIDASVAEKQRHLYRTKVDAVRHKWEMVHVAAAELDSLCDMFVGQYKDKLGVPMSIHAYLTLKIEGILMMARSLLDVLSTPLAVRLLSDHRVQSFNDLRKRGDCPTWLKTYADTEMQGPKDLSLEKRGWLSILVTDSDSEQCLRDFVVHRGVAGYVIRQAPFDEWELAFRPRPSDTYLLPIKAVVKKIVDGIAALARQVDDNLKPGQPQAPGVPPSALPAAVDQTMQIVNKALVANGHGLPLSVAALLPEAAERSKQTVFGNNACGTGYLPGFHELQVWHISLLLAEYLVALLWKKVKDGHCNNHRVLPDLHPCPTMQKEHLRMLDELRKAFEALAGQASILEAALKDEFVDVLGE